MTLNTSIGTKITYLRKTNNLTQEQLAEKLDISIKHCSAVERGLSCFSLEKLIEVSNLFDVSLDFLVKDSYYNHESSSCICDKLPFSIVKTFRSGNESEIRLLREYLSLYTKLRDMPK